MIYRVATNYRDPPLIKISAVKGKRGSRRPVFLYIPVRGKQQNRQLTGAGPRSLAENRKDRDLHGPPARSRYRFLSDVDITNNCFLARRGYSRFNGLDNRRPRANISANKAKIKRRERERKEGGFRSMTGALTKKSESVDTAKGMWLLSTGQSRTIQTLPFAVGPPTR